MKNIKNNKIKKIMSNRKRIALISSIFGLIFFLILTSQFIYCLDKISVYKDYKEIFKYYDYVDADNYKMITPKGMEVNFFDKTYFLKIESFYVDDFDNIYKVNYSQSLFFKSKTEQTVIKPKNKNGTLIRISDGNRPICSCDIPCSHKDLMTACRNPYGLEIEGLTTVAYCYDYVNENDVIMIRPDSFEKFCIDNFGKAYRVKYTLHGREITELKSKREGGIIVSVCATHKGEMIFPLSASETPT